MINPQFGPAPQFGMAPQCGWNTLVCWCPEAVPAVRWDDADDALQSAEATLNVGTVVYLTVESLGGAGWDWMVWDHARRTLPHYGRAETAAAARHSAELTFAKLSLILIESRAS